MSNSNHTPGPWTTKPTASLGPQYAVYPEAGGPDIAIVYDHGNTAANAHLIAAAPELLAALEQILAAADDPDNEKPRDFVDAIDWQAARAALAKARPL